MGLKYNKLYRQLYAHVVKTAKGDNMALKLIKENKKSLVYENDKYIIKEKEVQGGYYVRNGATKNPYYDVEKDENDQIWIGDAVILEITNKENGKKCQKKCLQGHGAAYDFQDALDGKNPKFKDVIKKLK